MDHGSKGCSSVARIAKRYVFSSENVIGQGRCGSISSVAASHSLTLQTGHFPAVCPAVCPVDRFPGLSGATGRGPIGPGVYLSAQVAACPSIPPGFSGFSDHLGSGGPPRPLGPPRRGDPRDSRGSSGVESLRGGPEPGAQPDSRLRRRRRRNGNRLSAERSDAAGSHRRTSFTWLPK